MNVNKKNQKGLKGILSAAVICGALSLFQVSCLSEYAPGQYYTFSGETVATFLENNSEDFSNFIYVLKNAEHPLWGEMQTYGTYTCFAPVNSGWDSIFKQYKVSSVDQLTPIQCDSIAMTHIVDKLCYTSELNSGDALPYSNKLDQSLLYSCIMDTLYPGTDSARVKPFYQINNMSGLIALDDTVQNGVVHVVNKVILPSNEFLPIAMKSDSTIRIFLSALEMTKLNQDLLKFQDDSYQWTASARLDSCIKGVSYSTGSETETAYWPEKRLFKFTVFAEKDAVFQKNNINSVEDLIEYAKGVYGSGEGVADDDYSNPQHPLYKFVAYHILPEQMAYNEFNVSQEDIVANFVARDYLDIEDFFETLLPHSILRISSPKDPDADSTMGVFINRKGVLPNLEFRGIEIERGTAHTSKNGIYHYIDDILKYDDETRSEVLNCRIRIDAMTLSPDFINCKNANGGRGVLHQDGTRTSMGMRRGYITNFVTGQGTAVYVRKRDKYFSSYEGDDLSMKGIYDLTFKLPPVPKSGTYEVRLGFFAMKSRGVIQLFFGEAVPGQEIDPNDLNPVGIPLDMRIIPSDPKIGHIKDSELNNDPEQISAYDKAMRSRGYMKGIACYASSGTTLRDQNEAQQMDGSLSGEIRRILVTQYLNCNQDYYIRARQILDNPNAEFQFDYLELVPKNIYAGAIPEDIY